MQSNISIIVCKICVNQSSCVEIDQNRLHSAMINQQPLSSFIHSTINSLISLSGTSFSSTQLQTAFLEAQTNQSGYSSVMLGSFMLSCQQSELTEKNFKKLFKLYILFMVK